MTELENMRRAKRYMDLLAQGIDPVSGRAEHNDSVLNQAQLVRCFFYVSGVLQRVIDQESRVREDVHKRKFSITPQRLAGISVKPYEIRITEFTKLIYEAAGDPNMRQLNATRFSNWLLEEGFLTENVDANGKTYRLPTKAGEKIGISVREYSGKYGNRPGLMYAPEAQQFLLDHYWAIVAK